MNLNNIKAILKKRWIYYLCGYLFGYILPLLMDGIHGWQSLFPIKIMGIASAIMLGNICYQDPKKITLIKAQSKSLKYTIIILVIFLIIEILRRLMLAVFDFNIMSLIL